ncbi:unnamed protein product [Urochloa decumbens]|uniref:4-aminobutyrate--pyruvate transaminase n=1 Tax=Urochloa decumbens TaxID=240449 RepID=A0ABC9CAX5_9POAL
MTTPHDLLQSGASTDQVPDSAKEHDHGVKEHDALLAPFTAAWQTAISPPLIIDRSEGCYVYDVNGNKYLDALAGLLSTALGIYMCISEPRLIQAATEQLNKLPFYHSFWNHTTRPSLDLANELISMFTAREMGKVFFTNSGSEANDSQVKIVWYYNNALGRPKKKKSLHDHNHIMEQHSYPLVYQVFLPCTRTLIYQDVLFCTRTALTTGVFVSLIGETEEDFATRLANNLENLILKEGPETIAAFIAEPVIGAGGVILPPKTYFEKIQAVVKKYDILFIADEVITGFGRLGAMFGSDLYNIKPDLVSLAKALSSAYAPIGAVLVSPEISDVIHSHSNKLGTFAHGFTYSGHPVSCAVSLEALKIYRYTHFSVPKIAISAKVLFGYDELFHKLTAGNRERNIPGHVTHVAKRFQEEIKAFAAGSPIIGETRGVGLLIATEFTDNKSPYELFPFEWGVGEIFGAECKKRGMMVKVLGNLIAMSPPLIITHEEIDELVRIYGEALKATEERVATLKSKKN